MKTITAALTLALSLAFALSPLFTNPFSGFTEDQLPIPQIDPPVQPAGYAFAIWGLIYAWLVVSAAFGLWKRREDEDWAAARPALCISLAVGVPWLAIANASPLAASAAIIIMAAAAIIALTRAPARDIWLFQVPTGLYAGWLTAASFVSLATIFAGYGIALTSYGWAIAGIIGALTVALITYRINPAPAYFAAVIWALVGIIIANGTAQLGVSALAALGIAVLVGAGIRLRRTT